MKDISTGRAMHDVLHAGSLYESLECFEENREVLRGCKFAFASDSGVQPGRAAGRDFPNGAAVRSLFASQRVVILDEETLGEMRSGGSTFLIDHSISLDSNALSYLLPYFNGSTSRLPADFADVFDFMADPNTNVDPVPYRFENLVNLTRDPKLDQRIFDRLHAYEVLRTLDKASVAKGMPRSSLQPLEVIKGAQAQMASLYQALDDRSLMSSIREKHGFMYYLLLRMCTIQLSSPKRSAQEKIFDFCKDCDENLATIFARETLIARRYFECGQAIGFFGKIMVGGKSQLERLQGMAWDFWHVRQLELAITLKPGRDARFFFPALLTFDQGLIEMMDMYPLQACAWIQGVNEPKTRYAGDWLREVAGDESGQGAFMDRFYSPSATARRESSRNQVRRRLVELIAEAESAFLQVSMA